MWKKHQEQRKVNSKIKLALITLVLLIFLLAIAKAAGLLGSFNYSLGSNFSLNNNSSWDGKTAINLVYASIKDGKTALYFLNFIPATKKITVIHLSDEIYAELPKNYGSWKIGSIYQLAEEDKKTAAPFLIKLSVAKLIGLPVDGIIVTASNSTPEQIISSWHSNPLNIISFIGKMKTDLSLLDASGIFLEISKVRSDKVASLDLARSSITESKLLPDSSRVLGLDSVKMDVYIRSNLADDIIQNEGMTVAVFNATQHRGLGSEVAREIINLGVNVVIISDTGQLQEKSLVTSSLNNPQQDKNNQTFKRLAQIFATRCLKIRCESNDAKITGSRAQINVVIGEDYYNLWYKR